MGRVIIKLRKYTGHEFVSLKCGSIERAEEIARRYNNLIEFNYYDDNARIPKPEKKKKINMELTLEEMERMISKL